MTKLIILRGLPGSGKSTYAEALLRAYNDYKNDRDPASLKLVRINKDDMRAMLNGGPFFGSDDHINRIMYDMVHYYLASGISVVSDNMNFNPKHIQKFADIVNWVNGPLMAEEEVQIELHDFETPYGECLARNAKRAVPVPIDQMEIVRDTWCRNKTINGFPELPFLIPIHWRHPKEGVL